MAVYSRTVTKQVTDADQLQYVEDIKYGNGGNPPRVGGVSVTITGRVKDSRKSWGASIASETLDSAHLDQQIDVLYNGAVVGRISIVCVPDVTIPSGHSTAIDTTWTDPTAAAALDIQTLA